MVEKELSKVINEAAELVGPVYEDLNGISLQNHQKVLAAFHRARVSEFHLKGSTGYGYGDSGREAVEKVFASVFKAEAALVRGQIASGTHAITLCLFGILRPGDQLLVISGKPYDTLRKVIGSSGSAPGSLADWGIQYKEVALLPDGNFDQEEIVQEIHSNTKVVMIQRSRGYDWRPAIDIEKIKTVCDLIKGVKNDTVIFN